MEWLDIRFVGVNAENGQKLLLTVLFVIVIWLLRRGLYALWRVLPPLRVETIAPSAER